MSQQPSSAQPPKSITYYWLATIVTDRGKQLTCDATIDETPGIHTRMTTVRSLMNFLREKHGEFVLLYLYLEPNEITAPPRPAPAQ
jgi:hypothetical protein